MPDFLAPNFLNVGSFLNGNYSFPDEGIDPEKKDGKYFLRVVQAAWYLFVNNKCLVPYNNFGENGNSIDELRAYASGMVNPNKYKPQLCKLKNSKHPSLSGKTYMNISWRPVPLIPKFVDIAKGMFMQMEYDFSVQSVDPLGIEQKELQKAFYKVEHNLEYRKFVAGMEAIGVKVNKDALAAFENEQQVDLFFKMGGYRLKEEAKLYYALKATMDSSSWDIIRDKIFLDLITCSRAASCTYVEPNTQEVLVRYSDIKNVVARHSDYPDGRDRDWIGEIRYNVPIHVIRSQYKVTETEIRKILSAYARNFNCTVPGIAGGVYNTVAQDKFYAQNGYYEYDGFGVDLLEFYYISGDTRKYTSVYNKKKGRTSFKKVGYEYEMSEDSKRDGKKLSTQREERMYKIVWPIGMDFVFDYGLADDVGYRDGSPMLPIQTYSLGSASLVQRMIGFQDDINLATYKWRNALAMLAPPVRMIIDQGAISNVMLGGVKMTPDDVFNLYGESGKLLTRTLNDHRQVNSASPGKPVEILPSGIAEDFTIFTSSIDFNTNMMRLVIGMNESVDGSTQGERKGARVAQMEAIATNNALFPIQRGYINLFERTFDCSMLKWQVVALGDKEIKYQGLSDGTIEVIRLGADLHARNFGLKVKIMPNKEEKEQLLGKIEAMYAGRLQSGQGGISPDAYFTLQRIVQSGNMVEAEIYLVQAIERQRKIDAQVQQQSVQFTADAQQQSAQASSEFKMNELQMEAQIKLQSDMELKKMDIQMEQLKSELKQREMVLEAQLKSGLIKSEEEYETLRTTMKLKMDAEISLLTLETQERIAKISAAKKENAKKVSKSVA